MALAARALVPEFQAGKRHQPGLQGLPKAQAIQEGGTGVGEGVGPLAPQERGGIQRVIEVHVPAHLGQGKGRQATGGTGPMHVRLAHRHWLGIGGGAMQSPVGKGLNLCRREAEPSTAKQKPRAREAPRLGSCLPSELTTGAWT